jgi:hypothetical protein
MANPNEEERFRAAVKQMSKVPLKELSLAHSLGCRISGPSLGVDTEMYSVHALRFISPAMPIWKLRWDRL